MGEATDLWSVSDQGSFTGWTVDTSGSDDPGSAAGDTSYEFSMRYLASNAARADSDWNVTVHVYDDDATPEVDYGAETVLVTMNQFFSVSFSTGTFSWGTDVQPNSINNTHGALIISVIANSAWELRISALDFTASAESDVDVEANNIICWDQDGSNDGISQWIRNTVATLPTGSTWDAQSAMSTEATIDRSVYIFLSPASLFVVGKSWSVIVTVAIQADA